MMFIVDAVGTVPFTRSKSLLKEGGCLVMVLVGLPDMLQIPLVRMMSSKKAIAGPAMANVDDLLFLAELAVAGKYKPVIDRVYMLEQIVDAHHYVDTGRKKENVVITVLHDDAGRLS